MDKSDKIHVYCEDLADYDLFNGFKRSLPGPMDYLAAALEFRSILNGDKNFARRAHSEIVKSLRTNRVLLICDFDNKGPGFRDEICRTYGEGGAAGIGSRMFVIGMDDEPEAFKSKARLRGKGFGDSGRILEEDWFSGTKELWRAHLSNSVSELDRLCACVARDQGE